MLCSISSKVISATVRLRSLPLISTLMPGPHLAPSSGQPGTQTLGCSRCRFAAGGCSRCRKLGYTPRGAKREQSAALRQDDLSEGGRKRRRQSKQTQLHSDAALPSIHSDVPAVEQQPASRTAKSIERHASKLLGQGQGQQQHNKQAQQQQQQGAQKQQSGAAAADLAQTVRKRLRRGGQATTHSLAPEHQPHQQGQGSGHQQQDTELAAEGAGISGPGLVPSQQESPAPPPQQPATEPAEGGAAESEQCVADATPDAPSSPAEGQEAQLQEPSTSAAGRSKQPPATFMQMLQQRMDTQRHQNRDAQRQQLLLTPQKAAQLGRSPAKGTSPANSTDRVAVAVTSTAAGSTTPATEVVQRGTQHLDQLVQQQQKEQQKEQHRQQQQELQRVGAPLAVDQHVEDDAAMTEVLLAEAAATPTTSGSGRSSGAAASDMDGAAGHAKGKGKAKKKRKPQPKPPKKGAYAHLRKEGDPDPRITTWVPPQSPYCLLEEELYESPWRTLLACMLLNKTTGKQVRNVIWQLFELCPTPEAAVAADVLAIQDIIYPLGLFRKRAIAVQRFSQDYLTKQWTCPTELHGIGKYAADAYYIFCRGRWEGIEPNDKDLKKYLAWLKATGGQGAGLERTSPHKQQQPQQQQPALQTAL